MNDRGQVLIYTLPNGKTFVEVLLNEENIWMTQAALAELYQTSPQNITMHIKNIYSDNELNENATCKSDLQVRTEGNREVKRTVKYYNLEMIIAIGFRAKSSIGNSFRKWANSTIHEYMVKGFVRKEDVSIAKNYLSNNELKSLEKIVVMYLDHAEEMAKEHIPMHMKDWINALDEFLKFERKDLLECAGKISHSLAQQKAFKEYEVFNQNRIESGNLLQIPKIENKR